ncbi:RsmB/NOP family class I SAM-dependent RNA methyltransferase [Propionicimonas sp.]|uniref:RsmB/NOP family class I SAM-dependent RNA methyltransferase n=1 Tax=Propionicimonas sp. TaxID=1955623 RepID=UPI0039E46DAA
MAAYEVLRAVRVEDAYANLVLPHVLARLGLGGRDAAFATELASGALRQRGTYDAVVAACVDRGRVEAKVLDLLRLGAHQLLAMRVPDHAAISTTVELARTKADQRAAGFVNAVLRRIARQPLAAWIAQVAPDREVDHDGWASVAHSHPRWVVALLREALGGDVEETDALLTADNLAPRVTLVARPGRAGVAELPGTPTGYSPFGVVLESGSPSAVPAVAEGRAGVQDEGSQLVALALAESGGDRAGPDRSDRSDGSDGSDGPAGEVWLDLCAGPGGKSALLAALAAERGAVLVANERQPHRAGLVRGNLTEVSGGPVPGAVGVVAGDGLHPPYPPGSFDRILVDAPCSGLGALRRRPEARWRRSPGDLPGLVELQRGLLTTALGLVRPGGLVLYSTCSPVLAETGGVVEAVLAARGEAAIARIGGVAARIPDAAGPVPGTVQLWPHRHGTDAMFLALLRRSR